MTPISLYGLVTIPFLVLLIFTEIAVAASTFSGGAAIISDASTVSKQIFDYIIVGGGNAGLVVANRLTEDPNINVLVIEAGTDTRNEPPVYMANETYGQTQGNSKYSHNFETVFQPLSSDTRQQWSGKGLGGSTTVNGQVWNAPSSDEVNVMGTISDNRALTWDRLLKYYKKAQNLNGPSRELATMGVTFDNDVHHRGGPVDICFDDIMFSGPPQVAFVKGCLRALGLPKIRDSQAGNPNGVFYVPATVYQHRNLKRVSSATSYLSPYEKIRPNLTILVGWRGTRLDWSQQQQKDSKPSSKKHNGQQKGSAKLLRAAGVDVRAEKDGPMYTIFASKEVIVSAGTIQSPLFLELSGIGSPTILNKIGQAVVIPLPGVGTHMTEQCQVGISANVKDRRWRGQGASSSIAQPNMAQLFPRNISAVAAYVEANVNRWASEAVEAGAAVDKDALVAEYKLMARGLFRRKWAASENFFGNGFFGDESDLSSSVYTLHPFSRGFTHAKSIDPFDLPIVDPRYWTADIDVDMEVGGIQAAVKVFNTPEVLSVRELGTPVLPEINATTLAPFGGSEYAFWRNHILSTYGALQHAVGTCSMKPRQHGGVVDGNFKVYGTANVRVVDASVIPMQMSAHTQASVYAFAEWASDIIKQQRM